jgi:4,5-DOPA dioxygenase extradiol
MDERRINPIFIGHGSPMNAIKRGRYSGFLGAHAASIPRPRAILVISAHWQSEGSRITASANPGQIYDFYGFPDELYELKYAPPGSPELAREVASEIPEIALDETRGIDHAGWAVAKHLYPEANVPLLELSLDYTKREREHYELGKRLAVFTDRGVLVIGSGNLVHNLREMSFDDEARPFPWALAADKWFAERIARDEDRELIEYRDCMPGWQRALPTDEHYLPFLYVLAMRRAPGGARTAYEEIQNGSVSMRSVEMV